MQAYTWTFQRNDERIVVQRQETDGGFVLVVMMNDQVSRTPFQNLAALAAFQSDMEEMLLHTGWSLASFHPERRERDRRKFPRVASDRRRWWTDPAPVADKPASRPATRSVKLTKRKRRRSS